MRFLDFIQQHHAIRLPAHLFAQLSAFLIPHIARRRADQSGYGELLHIFTHVDSHHIVLRIKKILCNALGKFRLSHTGRAEEEERTDRPVRVLQTCTVTLDGADNRTDSLILSDDPALQPFLHFQYPVPLGFGHLIYRNPGHLGYHSSYILLIDNAFASLGGLLRGTAAQPYH